MMISHTRNTSGSRRKSVISDTLAVPDGASHLKAGGSGFRFRQSQVSMPLLPQFSTVALTSAIASAFV
jgi:hypothetical protein